MPKFIIEHPADGKKLVTGEKLIQDGMGTRVVDAQDNVLFSYPKQLPAYREDAVTSDSNTAGPDTANNGQ